MTLMIELAPEVEARLRQAALRQGMDTTEYARQLIETNLPDEKDLALANLMHAWIAEDVTDDPAELEAREAEWEELKTNLNANRSASGERLLFP